MYRCGLSSASPISFSRFQLRQSLSKAKRIRNCGQGRPGGAEAFPAKEPPKEGRCTLTTAYEKTRSNDEKSFLFSQNGLRIERNHCRGIDCGKQARNGNGKGESPDNQAKKSTGWMPWRHTPKKDAASCEKPRGVASGH